MDETLRLRSEGMTWRAVESEIVVLDQRDSKYLAVNEAGAVLWPLLLEGATRSQLCDELAEHFGIDADRAAADVDAFLDLLGKRDLLAPA
ncbi:MAG: PqqD family protein [Acidimicrobiales bacterium]